MNGNIIPEIFHYYKDLSVFQAHLEAGRIGPDSICFIEETKQIYTQGAFFGICLNRFLKLEQMAQLHDMFIKNILGEEGPSVNDGAIDNLKELWAFLDGFTEEDDSLKTILDNMKSALEEQMRQLSEAMEQQRQELENRMQSLEDDLRAEIVRIDRKLGEHDDTLAEHKMEIEALKTHLSVHMQEWQEFSARYTIFRDYVNERFEELSTQTNTLSVAMQTLHDYVDTEMQKVEDANARIDSILDEVQEVHTLFGQMENDLDAWKLVITEFLNSKGHVDGIASLDSNGKIPSSQLPSYVDDVLEFPSKDRFPVEGESGKIYIDTDSRLTYRWSGTMYVEISPSLTLGENDSTAFPGSRGKELEKKLQELLDKLGDVDGEHDDQGTLREQLDRLLALIVALQNAVGEPEGAEGSLSGKLQELYQYLGNLMALLNGKEGEAGTLAEELDALKRLLALIISKTGIQGEEGADYSVFQALQEYMTSIDNSLKVLLDIIVGETGGTDIDVEEALRKLKEALERLKENVPDGTTILDWLVNLNQIFSEHTLFWITIE